VTGPEREAKLLSFQQKRNNPVGLWGITVVVIGRTG
jgi:hypothetical protein